MLKYLPVIFVITSCAQLDKQPANDIENTREVANLNFERMSCFEGAKHLISSSGKNSPEIKAGNFDPAEFASYFSSSSVEKVLAQLNDSIAQNQTPANIAKRLEAVRKLIASSKSAPEFIQRLTLHEKKILWFAMVKPQMNVAREEALKELSQKGDELAAVLLQVPRGPARENAESAVTLMRRISPDISTNQIIAEIKKRMSVCLK